MSSKTWLPITEYAGKYRVSISTLRRRIKNGDVEHSFSEGKYLLKDAPLSKHTFQNSPSAPQVTIAPPQASSGQPVAAEIPKVSSQEVESPILATANRLLNELKKAYSVILQEKEEQILQLKDEVADLKTLVRVLETENDRLNESKISVSSDTQNWLE